MIIEKGKETTKQSVPAVLLTVDLFEGHKFAFTEPTRDMLTSLVIHARRVALTHPALPDATCARVAIISLCHRSPFLVAPLRWFADMAQNTPDRFAALNARFSGHFGEQEARIVTEYRQGAGAKKGSVQSV